MKARSVIPGRRPAGIPDGVDSGYPECLVVAPSDFPRRRGPTDSVAVSARRMSWGGSPPCPAYSPTKRRESSTQCAVVGCFRPGPAFFCTESISQLPSISRRQSFQHVISRFPGYPDRYNTGISVVIQRRPSRAEPRLRGIPASAGSTAEDWWRTLTSSPSAIQPA